MKILLYSHTFWPNIGGVEDVTHVFAQGWTKAGHEVTVVTRTKSGAERPCVYKVVRCPDEALIKKIVHCHDLVHASGASLALFPYALMAGKPFSWSHHGYQLSCIDGAGWVKGKPAPMTPGASIIYHAKVFGLGAAAIGGGKLLVRRLVGHLVSGNVATSKHVAWRQKLPRQRVIYNPFDIRFFTIDSKEEAHKQLDMAKQSFTFLGRLVTEKGLDDLIHALATLNDNTAEYPTLRVIGDGPERDNLQNLANQLGLSSRVVFVGAKSGADLQFELAQSGICVIPSAWEEPGALTPLSLMAAGKPLIVSQSGWLSECAGNAAITFANRDRQALAEKMKLLLADKNLQHQLVDNALRRIGELNPQDYIQEYLNLFEEILATRKSKTWTK